MHAWTEVYHLLQSSKSPFTGFLCSIGWRITDQTRLSSNTPGTPTISNSAILHNNFVLCAHGYMWRKNAVVKEAIILQWVVRITSSDFKPGKKWWAGALLREKCCAKTIMKELCKFELARLKKKKEKHFGRLVTFWLGTFAMLFSATGCVVCHENTWRWTVGCYNGL